VKKIFRRAHPIAPPASENEENARGGEAPAARPARS